MRPLRAAGGDLAAGTTNGWRRLDRNSKKSTQQSVPEGHRRRDQSPDRDNSETCVPSVLVGSIRPGSKSMPCLRSCCGVFISSQTAALSLLDRGSRLRPIDSLAFSNNRRSTASGFGPARLLQDDAHREVKCSLTSRFSSLLDAQILNLPGVKSLVCRFMSRHELFPGDLPVDVNELLVIVHHLYN